MAALGEVGEHGVDLVDRHALPRALELGRQHQVFFAGEAGEDAALFGAIADAQVRDAVRRHRDGLDAVDLDAALAGAGESHHGAHRRRAARAIAAQQRDDFARLHDHVDAVQHVRFAVPGLQALDFECSGHQCAPCISPSVVPM
ncbi:hypothetical protein FQZ97_924150 [compost metagenome]